jgi:hypothetical protein
MATQPTATDSRTPWQELSMTAKTFSQVQYDADDNAKHQVIDFLTQHWGMTNVRINPNQYGIDLLADDRGKPTGIEVEVKHNWLEQRFPYDKVHFSARKTKFLDECPDVYFVMLSDDRTRMIATHGDNFQDARLVRKSTKWSNHEWFIQVDLGKFKMYNIPKA